MVVLEQILYRRRWIFLPKCNKLMVGSHNDDAGRVTEVNYDDVIAFGYDDNIAGRNKDDRGNNLVNFSYDTARTNLLGTGDERTLL